MFLLVVNCFLVIPKVFWSTPGSVFAGDGHLPQFFFFFNLRSVHFLFLQVDVFCFCAPPLYLAFFFIRLLHS